MKQIITTMLLLISFISTKAQDNTSVQKAIPKGSKVFVFTSDKDECKQAKDKLTKWGYWQIVDDKKDADFVMNITVERKYSAMQGKRFVTTSEFTDKNNNSVYKTDEVKVLNRDLAITSLVDKRIKKSDK